MEQHLSVQQYIMKNLNILCLLLRKGVNPNTTYPVETKDGAEFQMPSLVEALEMENSAIAFFKHCMSHVAVHLMFLLLTSKRSFQENSYSWYKDKVLLPLSAMG